ncbi:MAG: redox-sensing transcriptional repressor Rex [Candidatus Sumerlaeaceae bacterium]|nr:redox-sensing transcriptional repressor Rex [Candidatus Sumerlaeaceae bacterium]
MNTNRKKNLDSNDAKEIAVTAVTQDAYSAKPAPRVVPTPSVRRLPLYLRLLRDYVAQGRETISCTRLAADLRFDPTQVRKDLALTGVVGRPKVGYPVAELIAAIEDFLGWRNPVNAVLVGVGSLGTALLGYNFSLHGVNIVGAFDAAPEKVGQVVHGREIMPIGYLTHFIQHRHIPMGILAVPAQAAQSVAEMMVAGGVRAIWNFTSAALQLPLDVLVERADFSASLAVLTRALAHGLAPTPPKIP